MSASSVSSQSGWSPEALAERFNEITAGSDLDADFRANGREWLQGVGTLDTTGLRSLVISLAPNPQGSEAASPRSKSLRTDMESLLHLTNSAHLEQHITDLDTSTKELNNRVLDLTDKLYHLTEKIYHLTIALVVIALVPLLAAVFK